MDWYLLSQYIGAGVIFLLVAIAGAEVGTLIYHGWRFLANWIEDRQRAKRRREAFAKFYDWQGDWDVIQRALDAQLEAMRNGTYWDSPATFQPLITIHTTH